MPRDTDTTGYYTPDQREGQSPGQAARNRTSRTTTSRPSLDVRAVAQRPPEHGARRRLARQIREAALRSTATELLTIEALERAVRARRISIHDASQRLRRMLREQHQRTA